MLEEHVEVDVNTYASSLIKSSTENGNACVTCAEFGVKCLWWGTVQLAMEIKLCFSV